ncbi:MAG TPA: ABC transporter permease [Thermomicrobiales bacterium]|nr:ABC transporter permease [Thermomicrobiales bacterium]
MAILVPASSLKPATRLDGVAPIGIRGATGRPRHRTRPDRGGMIGLALVGTLVIAAFIGPWLVAPDPETQRLSDRLVPPMWAGGSAAHPLGTDGLGRDLLSRVVAAAKISLLIGVSATLLAGMIGVSLGLLAGALGGAVDRLIAWLTDVQLAVPFVIVAIAVTATLGNSLGNVILVLAVTGWVGYARIVRLQARTLRRAPFVEAARALGANPARILFRHLLPNLTVPVLTVAGQQVAAMILYEAALSYLGLGVPRETMTWGGMIAAGQETLATAWWVAAVPGICLALTILGFNLVADWLARVSARSQ